VGKPHKKKKKDEGLGQIRTWGQQARAGQKNEHAEEHISGDSRRAKMQVRGSGGRRA